MCALLVLALCAAAEGSDLQAGVGFGTPREAWDEYRHARHEGRWKDAYRCLTPESQERFVEAVVYLAACFRETDDKDTARRLKGMLGNHGIYMDRIDLKMKTRPAPKYVRRTCRQVKDREGLFCEAMALIDGQVRRPKGEDGKPVIVYGELTKIEITGDEAKGQFVKNLEGREDIELDGDLQADGNAEAHFRRIDGRWFCTMAGVQ